MNRFDDKLAIKWSKIVKERDNYICKICGKYDIPLHSHHLNSWNLFVNQRYDIKNGVCICQNCHYFFHLCFGKGGNTKDQFEQFKQSIFLIKKILYKLQHGLTVESGDSSFSIKNG